MPFLHKYLQQTLAAANPEHQHTLAEPRSDGPDLSRLAGALGDVRVGLKEKSTASNLSSSRAASPGGVFPLEITAGGEDDGVGFLEVYKGENGEGEIKLLNICDGGSGVGIGNSGEGGVNFGGQNPSKDFKSWAKCEYEVEGQDGEDEDIEEGGVNLSKEPNRAEEAVGFSQEFECRKGAGKIHESYIEMVKVPANSGGDVKLSTKKLCQHHRHGRVVPLIKSGYEADGEDEGGIKLLNVPDNGLDCEDGGVNLLDGNSDRGLTLPKRCACDDQGQGGEGGGGSSSSEQSRGADKGRGGDGGGVGSPHEAVRLCNKCQSQSEDQDLDDGGVCLSGEGQSMEHGGVELFNKPRGEGEGVRLPLEFEYEKEGGDGHQGNLEFAQETHDNDGGMHESEMDLPQQHKNLRRWEVEGAAFLQGDCGSKPSPAYLKLLDHFLV